MLETDGEVGGGRRGLSFRGQRQGLEERGPVSEPAHCQESQVRLKVLGLYQGIRV